MTLDELAIKYGSDKSSLDHNYCQFYEHALRTPPKVLLEIGVFKGASCRMWKEYFPDTRIIGMDLFIENPIPDIPGVEFIKGNQLDHELLYHIRNDINPDVIIDDGSHNSRDQLVTFYSLFHKDCKYFIEDVHCAEESFYQQGLPYDFTVAKNGIPYGFRDCQSPILLITC